MASVLVAAVFRLSCRIIQSPDATDLAASSSGLMPPDDDIAGQQHLEGRIRPARCEGPGSCAAGRARSRVPGNDVSRCNSAHLTGEWPKCGGSDCATNLYTFVIAIDQLTSLKIYFPQVINNLIILLFYLLLFLIFSSTGRWVLRRCIVQGTFLVAGQHTSRARALRSRSASMLEGAGTWSCSYSAKRLRSTRVDSAVPYECAEEVAPRYAR